RRLTSVPAMMYNAPAVFRRGRFSSKFDSGRPFHSVAPPLAATFVPSLGDSICRPSGDISEHSGKLPIDNARLFEEVQARTRELAKTVEELEIASQHKSQFVANMSHELRTPLAVRWSSRRAPNSESPSRMAWGRSSEATVFTCCLPRALRCGDP